VTEFDSLQQTLHSHPEPLTRDLIGLCIAILSIVLVIVIVAVCKWSRCLCLKQNHRDYDQAEGLTSVIYHNTSTSRQRRRDQNQRLSSCNHPGNVYPAMSRTRDGLLSSSQLTYNENQRHDLKVPRAMITILSVLPSQQLVPRLSISPQVSSSSITPSSYSIKQ
jgi:hypothetical protein